MNPEQAIRDFDYVSEMVPDHAFANYSRGEAYLNLGKYETARKEFEIANDLVVRSQRLKDSLFKYSDFLTAEE